MRWHGRSIQSLRALLGGTNVSVTESLQQMLLATAISSELAAPLLRGNSDWLLMHLTAANGNSRGITRAFLTHMHRGVDVGSATRWAAWLARALERTPAVRGADLPSCTMTGEFVEQQLTHEYRSGMYLAE